MLLESIKMVFKIFRNNKLRTILTMLGIYVGIVSVVIILAASNATKEAIKSELGKIDNSIVIANLREYEWRK